METSLLPAFMPLKSLIPEKFNLPEPVDYTFSVNVLNQLDILIIEYLRRVKIIASVDLFGFRKKIQSAHLNSLSAGKSSIITDYEEVLYDRTDTFVENRNLLFVDLPKNKSRQDWIWRFDESMSYYHNRKTHFKVAAIDL